MKLFHLISQNYIHEQQRLHNQPKGYGGRGDKWAPVVIDLAKRYDAKTILDYGCGQGTLRQSIKGELPGRKIIDYDPAIKGKDRTAVRCDLVICTDVLEHVEPEKLPIVVSHLFKLSVKALFLVIATRPSNKYLSDGRNAHLIIEPDEWWIPRLRYPSFRSVEAPKSPIDQPSRELVVLMERET